MKVVKKYLFLWGERTAEVHGETVHKPETNTSAAWCSGYAAAWDGYDFTANPYCGNPYQDEPAAEAWESGFREAEAEIAEIENEPETKAADRKIEQTERRKK